MSYYGNENYYGADGANGYGHEYYGADGANGNGHGHGQEIYYYGADGANGNYGYQNFRGRRGRGGRGGQRIGRHNGGHPLSDTAREAFVALLAEKQEALELSTVKN